MKVHAQSLTLEPLEDRTLLATCTVTNLLDVGRGGMSIGSGQISGDLRFCINQANAIPGPDVIDLMVNGTIQLRRPLPDLASDIDIQGPGSGLLTIRRNTGGDYRIFTVAAGSTTIQGLTVTNGKGDAGGGIYNQGDLTLQDVVVSFNTNTAGVGGGIYNTGTLAVVDSTIANNTSKGLEYTFGGGIYNSEFGQATITSSSLIGNEATGKPPGLPANVYGGGVYNAGALTMNGSTVSGNKALAACGGNPCTRLAAGGGGIYNQAGILELSGSIVSNNLAEAKYLTGPLLGTASGVGGGVFNAGAGEVTVSFSVVAENTARGEAYEPTYAVAAGGGFYNEGTLTVDDTTISENLADGKTGYDDAYAQGAGIANFGTLLVTRSTISDNFAMACVNDFGYPRAFGGGVYHSSGTATIINTTIANNEILALYSLEDFYPTYVRGGGLFAIAPITIVHTTIAHNVIFPDAPGDWAGAGVSGGNITMYNSIVAGNSGAGSPDVDGGLVSSGYNLIGNSNGGSGFVPTDLLDVDPLLGPLQDNGGPTLTRALLPGSPAIDAGDNSDAPEFDQRGPGFPRIVNGTIDMGAFEVQATGAPSQPRFLAFLITADFDQAEMETIP